MPGRDNNTPDKEQDSPMKAAIEHTYLQGTNISNTLRNILMCRCFGSREIEYRNFNKSFGYLFDITHHKREMDKELIKRCMKWFNTPRGSPTKKNIMAGLKLYDEYVTELFRLKLLKYE